MRRYVIVVRLDDNRVITVIESQPIDNKNVWDVSSALYKSWLSTSGTYPAPKYDIIITRGQNLDEVQERTRQLKGWESAPLIAVGC